MGQIYFYGLTIEINNFAFEVKVILGLKSTIPDGRLDGGWVDGRTEKLRIEPAQPSWGWDWG